MALITGQILNGRYRIVKRIAEGGYGAVYRAWDISLNMPCALKENLDTHEAVQEQFFKEASLLAGLRHPHLPRVTDYFAQQGFGQFLVMDFVDGQDLDQLLEEQKGPLPFEYIKSWIMQICDALIYLHNQNPPIIHRDIKPANIKISPTGQAMLVDFGIAKVFDAGSKTMSGAQAVTPGYSPPEQYGVGTTDIQSDIYALGATLYKLLTGRTPPDSLSLLTQGGKPVPLAVEINSEIPIAINQAIEKCMNLDKKGRFSKIEDLKSVLFSPPILVQTVPAVDRIERSESISSTPTQPEFSPITPVTAKPVNKTGWVWLGILGGGLVLFTIICLGTILGNSQSIMNLISISERTTQQAFTISPSMVTIEEPKIIKPSITILSPTITASPTSQPSPSISPTTEFGVGTRRVSDVDRMEMVFVPAGEFIMGFSDSDPQPGYAIPQHTVYLEDFWIDLNEITIAQFREFVESVGYKTQAEKQGYGYSWTGSGWNRTNYIFWQRPTGYQSTDDIENHPVAQVSWEDATAYCKWAGRRLPTEAEWEKAARGTDGRTYPWGDQEPAGELLNFADLNFESSWSDSRIDDSFEFTAPVGTYPDGVSPYGAMDMAGNVWEWTADWYSGSYYSNSPQENPKGPSSGVDRTIRGGGWGSRSRHSRTATRNNYTTEGTSDDIGFRCAFSGSTESSVLPSIEYSLISMQLEVLILQFLNLSFRFN